jgi:hypothetical protein
MVCEKPSYLMAVSRWCGRLGRGGNSVCVRSQSSLMSQKGARACASAKSPNTPASHLPRLARLRMYDAPHNGEGPPSYNGSALPKAGPQVPQPYGSEQPASRVRHTIPIVQGAHGNWPAYGKGRDTFREDT